MYTCALACVLSVVKQPQCQRVSLGQGYNSPVSAGEVYSCGPGLSIVSKNLIEAKSSPAAVTLRLYGITEGACIWSCFDCKSVTAVFSVMFAACSSSVTCRRPVLFPAGNHCSPGVDSVVTVLHCESVVRV